MPRHKLSGTRAIVTGASSGIGRALVRELAAHGVAMVVVARRGERLIELQQQLPSCHIVPIVGDVSDETVRRQAIEAAATELGGLDLLVNNAGISVQGEFADGTPDQARRLFDVNFFAAIELSRLALPLLRQSSRAAVVNISSILGHRAIPFNSEYCATKFALRGWSEAVRAEWAKWGIRVLVVSPGTTETEFFDSLLEKRRDMPWDESQGDSPESVANAIVRAITRGKTHIVPSMRGWLLVSANRIFPGFIDFVMRRFGKTPPRTGNSDANES